MSKQIAVILGGSGGLGEAIAHHLFELHDYRIVISSRDQTKAETIASQINQRWRSIRHSSKCNQRRDSLRLQLKFIVN